MIDPDSKVDEAAGLDGCVYAKLVCSRLRWTLVTPTGNSQEILRSKEVSHRIDVPDSTMEISIR